MTTNATLLRTLTLKSILGFGQYKDMSVRQIIELHHTAYLRWVYFCMDGISFNLEVLELIHVIGDGYNFQIKKPGKNEEKLIEANNRSKNAFKFGSKGDDEMLKIYKLNRYESKMAKLKIAKFNVNDRYAFKKSKMMARNHGH